MECSQFIKIISNKINGDSSLHIFTLGNIIVGSWIPNVLKINPVINHVSKVWCCVSHHGLITFLFRGKKCKPEKNYNKHFYLILNKSKKGHSTLLCTVYTLRLG